MATTTKKVAVRRDWTRDDVKELKKHSKRQNAGKNYLQNTQAHPGCRKT